MTLPLDYETLRVIWWLLMGVLLIGFALTDGFDLGVASLLPWVAKTDEERRMVINTVGATWEGNQVWFILGGGAIFAAWPFVYAVSFSGFYLAMFLVLAALILRPVGFKYRSKRPDAKWRARWDWALFVGGFVPALVFGVAVGNVLLGLPFRLDSDLRSFYDGTLLGLFTPFSLLAGLLSVAMLVLHGAGWLSLKAEQGPVLDRARTIGQFAAIAAVVLFVAGGLYVAWGGLGFRVEGVIDTAGPSNPRLAGAVAASGAWLDNYAAYPWMIAAPLIGLVGPVGGAGGDPCAPRRAGVRGVLARQCRDHRNRRPVDVPVHPAECDRSGVEPDGVERVVEPHDVVHHAGRDARLPADRAALHRMGLSRAVRSGDDRTGPHQPRFLLIERKPPCGISPGSSASRWPSPWPCSTASGTSSIRRRRKTRRSRADGR